jgi:hypothetical protein
LRSGFNRHIAVTWASVVLTFAASVIFWWGQNRWQPVGGAIAFPKALWLADALVLWIVLPLCIVRDKNLVAEIRRAFRVLLILMALRVAVEGWMLYVSLNWSPWYGIAHNLLCLAVLVALAVLSAKSVSNIRLRWRIHLAVTTFAFVPEIYFAGYMQHYFNTKGTAAVYFVPDASEHALVLNITLAVVVCFTAYIFIFLFRWLHAASDGSRAGAR